MRRAAERFQVSPTTAARWASRYRQLGKAEMNDRSSRPHRSPRRTPTRVERRIIKLRVLRRWGPARIRYLLGLHPSTVHRVLSRYRLARLAWLDRATGQAVGGRHARATTVHRKNNHPVIGYQYLHNAVDDHSRLAYSEILPDEREDTAAAFWPRAHAWFASCGLQVKPVLTDNGACYRSRDFAAALGDITHKWTRPYRPQTNGKVERFNRTLLEEWAYARPYTSNAERVAVGFVKRLGSTMVVDVAPARGQLCGLSVAGWASHLVYDLCCAVVALPVMTAEPARRGLLVRRLVIGAAALGLVVLLILLVVVL